MVEEGRPDALDADLTRFSERGRAAEGEDEMGVGIHARGLVRWKPGDRGGGRLAAQRDECRQSEEDAG